VLVGGVANGLAYSTAGAACGMATFLMLLPMLIGTLVSAWLLLRAAKMNAAACSSA